jgi:hypothetical protein
VPPEESAALKVIGVNAVTVALFLMLDAIVPVEKWPGLRRIKNPTVRKGLAPLVTASTSLGIYLWKRDSWYALPVLSGGASATVCQLARQLYEMSNNKNIPSEQEIAAYYNNVGGALPEYVVPQLAEYVEKKEGRYAPDGTVNPGFVRR